MSLADHSTDWFRILKKTGRLAYLTLKVVWITVWSLYQLALGAVLVLLVIGFLKVTEYFDLWKIRDLRTANPETTAFMETEKDRIKDSLRMAGTVPHPDSLVKWSWLPMDSIPGLVREIALVAEDAKFFQHQGFDLEQIEYAIVANHQAGKKARGASTISQQVAKNLFLTKEKAMSRKLREAALTLLLEHYLGKERILEIYLNIAQFDAGVFGIRAGSLHHYGKEPGRLTQEETVNLLCLLPSPVKWDIRRPHGGFLSHKKLVMKNYVLFKGMKLDFDTTDSQWQEALFSNLAGVLSDERWKPLRTRPAFDMPNDSAADSTRSRLDGILGTPASQPQPPRPLDPRGY